MNLKTALFIFTIISGASLWSQSLEQLASEQKQEVGQSLEKLRSLREEIKNKQIPLAQELTRKENELKALRKRLLEKQAARDNKSLSLENLQLLIKDQTKEYNYIFGSLLNEYFSKCESLLSAGRIASYQEEFRELNLLAENSDNSQHDRLTSSLQLLSNSIDQLKNGLGGEIYAGQALNQKGQLLDGKFIEVGPLLYFSSQEQPGIEEIGLVEETKTFQARIIPLADRETDQIRIFATGDSQFLPIDPSLGDAIAIAETKDSLIDHIKKGGTWVYPILFFALLSTIIALLKGFQIFKIRHPSVEVVNQVVALLRDGKRNDALSLAEAQPSPGSEILIRGIENSDESIDLLEEIFYESMLNIQPRLERFLNIIAVTAAIAPLLGLLGTVTGIIKTFKLMNVFGAGDPKPLLSGISEALITTELGLILAIPALIIHALLSRKVKGILDHMEKLAVSFINTLSRKSTPE